MIVEIILLECKLYLQFFKHIKLKTIIPVNGKGIRIAAGDWFYIRQVMTVPILAERLRKAL